MNETEPTAPGPSEAEPEPAADAPAGPPPARGRRPALALAAVAAVLFLLLFAALGWVWARQQALVEAAAVPPAPAPTVAQVTALQHRLDALAQQVSALQDRPAPQPAAPVDLAPLQARVAALEQRQPQVATPDLGPLEQKLDTAAAAAQAAKSAEADIGGRLKALEQRLGTAEQQATRLAGTAAQARRLQRAQVALDAGDSLGDIPGAPPALARFADTPPPTDAQLRLSFPAAAAAAERASRPSIAGKSFGERVWLRMRALVTVRQGDRVLLGTPAAAVLGQAQARLDAGDLGGALAALGALDGTAAAAMAPWRTQAQALLDARAALAQMARG